MTLQKSLSDDTEATAKSCADHLIASVSERNIKAVLHYLHLHSQFNLEMDRALNTLLDLLQRDEKLLRAALFGECRVMAVTPCALLFINRHPRESQEALLQSELAAEFKARGTDVHPEWAHGATLFVENLTMEALERAGITNDMLRPWHVLIRVEHEHRVHAVLRSVQCRPRPRLSSTKTVPVLLINDADWSATEADDSDKSPVDIDLKDLMKSDGIKSEMSEMIGLSIADF